MSTPATQVTHPASSNGRWRPPPPGTRSAEQIRGDIVRQRHELSRSVDALRPDGFGLRDALGRLERDGDPWAGISRAARGLPRLR